MYSIQKRDRPLEIHPPRRMRATPGGDDSDFTDDGYEYEGDPEKAYYVDESRLSDSGKGNHEYSLQDEGSDSEYDNSDSEEDGEDASEGDTDSDDDDLDNSDNAASESESNLEVAPSSADPIATSIENNDSTELSTKPAPPEPPVTPTKSTRTARRAVSQLSPQRRQTPMLLPPSSSIKAGTKSSFIGISSKASAAVFSKEM